MGNYFKNTWIPVLALLLAALGANAQKPKVITYVQTMSFSPVDMEGLVKEVAAEKSDVSDSSLITAISNMKELSAMVSGQKVLMEAWREGDDVVTRELNNADGKIYKQYNVHTLAFRVIDSFTYRKINRIDTFNTSMDYKVDPAWEVTYSITKGNKSKKILNYTCSLYTIVQTKRTAKEEKRERTTFTVWATTEIKPPLSIHALLGFYSKVLLHSTPV